MLRSQDDFDDEWQEMPIEHIGTSEDPDLSFDNLDDDVALSPATRRAVREAKTMRRRREHLRGRGTTAQGGTSNVAGKHLDVHDVRGYDWRTRPHADKDDISPLPLDNQGYTQVRLDEDEEEYELQAATDYLFQEDVNRIDDSDDPTAAPISQLAMTKRLLSESQKIAYVGLCSTLSHQMLREIEMLQLKDRGAAVQSAKEWILRVMVRLYQHLDIEPTEQAMIESLSQHGILPTDLSPSLVTTHTIPNPAYNPRLARQLAAEDASKETSTAPTHTPSPSDPSVAEPTIPETSQEALANTSTPEAPVLTDPNSAAQIAERQHEEAPLTATTVAPTDLTTPSTEPMPHSMTLDGVTTEISETSKTITLDIRWTVLCDFFLVLTADSVYDARSRVLLERLAETLGLTWMDVTKFEKRITDALEIEEYVQALGDKGVTEKHAKASRNRRMVMMGLATLGGGLVIGLSAGLLAPVIGAGIGAALGAVGISGTSAFLGGVGGATIITTTGTISGATLGGRGMSRRVRSVKTFEFRPLHYHKRVNCIVTVPGFLKGPEDDPTLPYSVIDPVMGDAFSIMWEPEMMRDMGNAMSILWNETLVQGVQQVLAATVAGAMFSALAWPLWLSKLNYLIDNPWSNATERARAAGAILADVLINRQLGVRPITLVGFSLGARMIFYALLELAKKKAFGVVQNVYIMGAPVTANEAEWKLARSTVSGKFVNAYSRSDWLLAYLHRATAGGVRSIAGLHPVKYDCRIENVDVTHLVPGHLSYRALTPLVLGELGFKTTADYFDEPEDLEKLPEREVVETDSTKAATAAAPSKLAGLTNLFKRGEKSAPSSKDDDDLPERLDTPVDGPEDAGAPTLVAAAAAETVDTEQESGDDLPTPATSDRSQEEKVAHIRDARARQDAAEASTPDDVTRSSPEREESVTPSQSREASSANTPAPLTENDTSLDRPSTPTPSSPRLATPPTLPEADAIPPPDNEAANTSSYSHYGLSSEEAQSLARQFHGLSMSASTTPTKKADVGHTDEDTPWGASDANPWD